MLCLCADLCTVCRAGWLLLSVQEMAGLVLTIAGCQLLLAIGSYWLINQVVVFVEGTAKRFFFHISEHGHIIYYTLLTVPIYMYVLHMHVITCLTTVNTYIRKSGVNSEPDQ